MSLTHTLTIAYTNGAETLRNSVERTSGAEANISETIAASQTDKLVAFTLDVSQAKSVFVQADAACTVETNSSSAPDNTLSLVADEPIIWYSGSSLTNPFTVDVTKLYVTTTVETVLDVRVLYDPTV